MLIEFKFDFGEKLIDKITGFKGTVVSVYSYDGNYKSYQLQPPVDADGNMRDCEWISESSLERQ